jgi:1-acyl-sn-glycerol-3-phosphate acyltransferase
MVHDKVPAGGFDRRRATLGYNIDAKRTATRLAEHDATMSAELDALTRINVEDLISGIGLQDARIWRGILARLCTLPARQLARRVLAYDHHVGQVGLHASGHSGLTEFNTTFTAVGAERLPRDGPLLLTANHPGLADALMVFANVPRADLRVIAASRSFLRALPNISRHLIYVDLENKDRRHSAIRAAAEHLRQGGALLTFPAGTIEPDPALHALDTKTAFMNWSASIDLLARFAPQTRIVPVLISGVLNPRAQTSLVTRLRSRQQDREWLGATLQLLLPRYKQVHAEIRFGEPLVAGALPRHDSLGTATDAVVAAMRNLLDGYRYFTTTRARARFGIRA